MSTVRRPVAVVLSRFPTVSETFILREVEEMERRGQPVRLVPLLRQDPPVVHEEARPWMRRALFTPFLSPAILLANLRALAASPVGYLRLLGRLASGTVTSPVFFLKTLAFFPKAVYLGRRLEAEGIRHLHAHFATHPTTVALVASTLNGLTYSFTAHAHDIQVNRELLEEKLLRARFTRVISAFNRDDLLRRYPAVAADSVRVIHVGVPTDRFPAAGADGEAGGRQPAARDRREARIVTVAALRPYKGLTVLVDACAKLRNEGLGFRCDVVGGGPMRRELERRIAELGLEETVRLHGALPQQRVPELLAEASVFVLPSVVQPDGQTEGIPVALMEAMASGLPVVSSRLSGIPELVEDGVHGRLLEPGDDASLAAAIRDLLQHPERREAMGEAGRARVAGEFSLEACTDELLEELDAVNPAPSGAVLRRIRSTAELDDREAVGVRSVHEGDDAWVAELLLPPDGEAVLKVHRDRPGASGSPAERAEREFRALRSLRDEAFGPGAADRPGGRSRPPLALRVPPPLLLDRERGAVLMGRCPGPTLLELLRSTRRRPWADPPAELAAGLRAAGAWLDRLHASTTRTGDAGPAEAGDALDALAGRARRDVLSAASSALDPDAADAVVERVRGLRARCSAAGGRVGLHGDFWPGNVFVAPDALCVVDLEGYGRGHPVEDPAYFALHLELYHAYPGLRRRGRRLAALFLEGLTGRSDGVPAGGAAWELGRTAAAARVLLRDVQREARAGAPEGLLDGLRRRRLRRALRRVLGGRRP